MYNILMRINIIDRRVYVSLGLTIFFIIASTVLIKPKNLNKTQVIRHKIALLKGANNNVQKKSTGQILWQDISSGEELAQGDFLRTSTNSSAEVVFLNSTDKIKLGEETTIIIEKKQSKIALNMIEGAIFVDNFQSDTVIDLTTGDETFKFQKSQINLDLKAEEVFELEVLSGSVNTAGKKIRKNERLVINKDGSSIKKNHFMFSKPEIGKNIYIDPRTGSVEFIWGGHKSRYDYDLFIGRSKKSMTRAKILATTATSLKALVPAGTFYWQIRATSPHYNFESAVIQSQFVSIRNPVLLHPQNNEVVFLKAEIIMSLKWAMMSAKENVQLEVAVDKEFKNIIFTKKIDGINSVSLNEVRGEGSYFWRVRGFLNNEFDELISTISKFSITYKKIITPPQKIFPEDKQMFIKEESKGITFAWNGLAGISRYKLSVRNKTGFQLNKVIENTTYFLREVPLGVSYWKVASISTNNKISKYSDETTFELKTFPKIQLGDYPRKIFYNLSETFLKLNWETISEAEKYQVQISNALLGTKTYDSTGPNISLNFKHLGEYTYKIMAFRSNELIASSQFDKINVVEHPLLDSPRWAMQNQLDHTSDGFGNIEFKYHPVKGASYYLIEIRDLNSRIIRVAQSESTTLAVKSLYPGEYLTYIRSVDKFNRKSDLKSPITVKVPIKSDLKKPVLNKVKVR
jgi:hypothetical protein